MKKTSDLLQDFSRCKIICRNFPYPVVTVDEQGLILDGCDDIGNLLGKKIADLKQTKIWDIPVFSEAGVETLKGLVKESFETGASIKRELMVKTAQAEIAMEVATNLVSEDGGKLLFLVFHDVTCIRNTEKELEESRLKYLKLFENMRSGVAVYRAIDDGKEFVISEFNKVAEQSDRVTRKDVIGKNIKEVFPGVEKIGFLDVLRRVWETGTPEVFPPTLYEDARLGKVWWEDYLYKLPSGEVVAAFANITEYMQSLESLRKTMQEVVVEKNKIQAIVQGIGDGLFVVDTNGTILLFNQEASRMSGMTEEEAVGKSYKDVLKFCFEGSQREVIGLVDDVIKTGVPIKGDHELVLISKDGDQVPISHSASPIKGEEGMDGVAVVMRDMTNEREVDRLKTEFVSIASHQMYTPLMGTKWFLELLLRGKVGFIPPDQQKYLEQVNASNDRIISIVEDLLFASKVGAGDRYTPVKESCDLVSLIDDSIKQNVDLMEKNKITVIKSDDFPEHLTSSVDIQMIKRIFYNLISNACKYSKPLGTVEIGCDQSMEGEIVFSVKDNGFGIPQRQQSRIFERFFRADNVVTKVNEGTGLGLYIIKTLAEAHGGKIWFDSIENVGTTFYFSLPSESAEKKRKRGSTSRSVAFGASSETTNV